MVTCKLVGELGNQMYEIAATIAYAKKWGMGYVIPTHARNRANNATWKFNKVDYMDIDLPTYFDDETKFNELPYMVNVCLHGYYQALPYFMDAWEDVVHAFDLPWNPIKGKVSIHQRRTDYLQYPDSFPSTSLDYVKRGIDYFKELGYKDFTVFSDDLPWCKENITSAMHGVNIEYSEGREALQDMIYMSEHEHHIVANSTFSVWAAMLNKNADKIVVRPPFFLGNKGKHLYRDIYPKEWVIKEN